MHSANSFEKIGETIDDATGETFEKVAKILGFRFPIPKAEVFNYSFSGLKTSFLYTIHDGLKKNENDIEAHVYDLCDSVQKTIVDVLLQKLIAASQHTGIKCIAVAGGVSANSELRKCLQAEGVKRGWDVHIPEFRFSSDTMPQWLQ